MKNMMTKNKISIKSIIDFVRKAITCDFIIDDRSFGFYSFDIENNAGNSINFIIKPGKIEIYSNDYGVLVIDNLLSDRDKVELEALKIDIKEYNEEKALNVFNNFFLNTTDKLTNIDDLNDED